LAASSYLIFSPALDLVYSEQPVDIEEIVAKRVLYAHESERKLLEVEMSASKSGSSRRKFLMGAAPAIAGGLALTSAAREAFARPEPAGPAGAKEKSGAADEKIWSKEYWAQKGDIKLWMFRKRVGAPQPGKSTLPVLFLVHGSSISSTGLDLTVPGKGEYSLMNAFARFGFDVWTMDFTGYGRSSRGTGNSDIKDGVEDLNAALPTVVKETGQQQFHVFGESSGALRAGAFATARPEMIKRLVLAAFTYTGEGSPTLKDRAKQVEFYRTHNRRPRDREMIRSIFTRDQVGTSDPAVGDALADVEMKYGNDVPTGTYLDMSENLPIVDPLKIKTPLLIVRGEFDGIATNVDLINFFNKLNVPDRQFIILPGAAHALSLGINREQFWHVMRAFLDMPPRQDNFKNG
jgi:pimeloyl-ACP methyl ester carboxylesterase